MTRIMRPARLASGSHFNVQSFAFNAAQAIVEGSIVVMNANGQLDLAGADPSPIVGVALEAVNRRPGFAVSHDSDVVARTYASAEISVAVADAHTVFSSLARDAAGVVAPTQARLGDTFGVVLDTGIWYIDIDETVNTRLTVTDIDTDQGIWFFKFLASVLEFA